jgi:secreted PhoX family phosphatase
MGRFKHENCEWLLAKDGSVAFYMGCDEVNEYIYKFVTAGKFNPDVRAANFNLLDAGTLYVAKFNDDGTGAWLELSLGKNGLTAANGWTEQAQIHIRTRQAADRAGATMMDRPEWVATNKKTNDVFVTLTNNGNRGTNNGSQPFSNPVDGTGAGSGAFPAVDKANPRGTVASGGNAFGHIIRWKDDGDDSAATTFKWSVFVLAGDPQQTDDAKKGNIDGDAFGSPDGLWVDDSGYLWIQTDVSTSRLSNYALLSTPPGTPNPNYINLGNNQMLMADPNTRKVKRFLVGPSQCEITGVHMTPDRKTMFINIQHPGEDGRDADISATPKKFSSWPDGAAGGRPRSATIAITRKDGGIIGT